MGAKSKGEVSLRSKSDFQRFCAELRTGSHTLEDVVEGLRALVVVDLRPTERGRFAHNIVRYLGSSFSESEIRTVASQTWPSEISIELRSIAPIQGERLVPSTDNVTEPVKASELRELSREGAAAFTVVFMGDEEEHRDSLGQLVRNGFHCLRVRSLQQFGETLEQETVVGLVVGASWWAIDSSREQSLHDHLKRILELSNLCWIKLIRCPAWVSMEHKLRSLCSELHFAESPRSRLAIEDTPAITTAELGDLVSAAKDFVYADGSFDYHSPVAPAQDRLLRAATSRYLQHRFPTIHALKVSFHVRMPAKRNGDGLVLLVSVSETDVVFVVKVSSADAARDEAGRFHRFAHGTSSVMEFFSHGSLGALVLTPADNTHLGKALSLEDMLISPNAPDGDETYNRCIAAMDSAIAALQRFSAQIKPKETDIFCNLDGEEAETLCKNAATITVAGRVIDLNKLYGWGRQVHIRRAGKRVVQHGDAHPGNILFSSANTAVLIDFECAGLGPACYDLSMLWIHVFTSRFVAIEDEHSTVELLRDLLQNVPFGAFERKWSNHLRFSVNRQAVYLAHKAIGASFSSMEKQGCTREDVYGILAIILCREFLNPRLQQFSIRCAIAAVSTMLSQNLS